MTTRLISGAHHLRHRGKLSMLKVSCLWLNACPWNVKVSTERGIGVVLVLEPAQGNVVHALNRSSQGTLGCLWSVKGTGMHQPETMGPLRVKDMATPEVKFF
jgi:hypothetical protein